MYAWYKKYTLIITNQQTGVARTMAQSMGKCRRPLEWRPSTLL
jgi:hypothetical protein